MVDSQLRALEKKNRVSHMIWKMLRAFADAERFFQVIKALNSELDGGKSSLNLYEAIQILLRFDS